MNGIAENTVIVDDRTIFSAPVAPRRSLTVTAEGRAAAINAVGLPLVVPDAAAWWRKVDMELIVIAADLSPPVAALNAPERRERLSAIAKLAGELEQECRAYTKGWPELTDQEPPFQMIGPLHALATWASREREHIVGDARVNNNRISVRYAVAALMDLFSEGFGITATKSEKGATARFIYALLTDATGSPPRTDLLRDILRR